MDATDQSSPPGPVNYALPDGIHIGCAGWSVSSAVKAHFPEQGSHLQRYAASLPAVEINTSFYRPHKPQTYARWRDSVPANFRFSVKLPRTITHDARLQNAEGLLRQFVDEASHLLPKLGCLLVQLPPSLRFDAGVAAHFFRQLQTCIDVPLACEPRHASWFSDEAKQLLAMERISYVLADPPPVPGFVPAAQSHLVYVRLHGAPQIYHSRYSLAQIDRIADDILQWHRQRHAVWCIFDNTASGAAQPNALELMGRLRAACDRQ